MINDKVNKGGEGNVPDWFKFSDGSKSNWLKRRKCLKFESRYDNYMNAKCWYIFADTQKCSNLLWDLEPN